VLLFHGQSEAGGYGGAFSVGDQRDAFARLDGEAGLHGVSRTGHQVWLYGTESHLDYFTVSKCFLRQDVRTVTNGVVFSNSASSGDRPPGSLAAQNGHSG
jgi:hypothetical protein